MSTAKGTIGVLGAGTMGAGIVQVAAQNEHPVVVFDASEEMLSTLKPRLEKIFKRLIEKQRISEEESQSCLARIQTTNSFEDFHPCDLVIEAVVENLEIKKKLFSSIEQTVSKNCLLATNTSSLPVTAIATACSRPENLVGIHFFNPVPLMALVEIVSALQSSENSLDKAQKIISSWGKTVVRTKDTPGFIVNRIARPFYGEALRICEEQIADAATIDWAMKELGGFRMGPFELMDFIGIDINYTVSQTVFESFYYDPRYRPSILQKQLVDAGQFGKKTGRGFYSYSDDAKNPTPNTDTKLGEQIVMRIVSMLINEAIDAKYRGIASAQHIELAMLKGVNYPKGLLAWAEEIGPSKVLSTLEDLNSTYLEERYRPSPLLRQVVRDGSALL